MILNKAPEYLYFLISFFFIDFKADVTNSSELLDPPNVQLVIFCAGKLIPNEVKFIRAFDILGAGYGESPGVRLDLFALQTIHLSHRYFAVIVFLIVSLLSYLLLSIRNTSCTRMSICLSLLLGSQIILGVINVVSYLPLWAATLHNLFAVLLLLTLIYVKVRLNYAKNQTNFL